MPPPKKKDLRVPSFNLMGELLFMKKIVTKVTDFFVDWHRRKQICVRRKSQRCTEMDYFSRCGASSLLLSKIAAFWRERVCHQANLEPEPLICIFAFKEKVTLLVLGPEQ
jgi:hypothetical protein